MQMNQIKKWTQQKKTNNRYLYSRMMVIIVISKWMCWPKKHTLCMYLFTFDKRSLPLEENVSQIFIGGWKQANK